MRRLLIILSVSALFAVISGCKAEPESDEAILDRIEQATIKYFTEFAEPNTGMARERNEDVHGNIVTTGGTGFGMMARDV